MHKWARHFQNTRFEYWELINAVWAQGNIQKLEHLKYASARVKFDMIDYIRTISCYRKQRHWEKTGKAYPKMFSLSSDNTDGEENPIIKQIASKGNGFGEIDTKDLFNYILKGCSRTEKLIILLRYECNLTLEEIAKTIGVTDSTICLKLKSDKLLELIRRRLIKIGVVKRECLRTSSFRYSRDKDAMAIYNRRYYNINKDRIQARRKALKQTD